MKQIWNFNELTEYESTGTPLKATREKSKKMHDVLVDCLVGFLKQIDEQDWNIRSAEG